MKVFNVSLRTRISVRPANLIFPYRDVFFQYAFVFTTVSVQSTSYHRVCRVTHASRLRGPETRVTTAAPEFSSLQGTLAMPTGSDDSFGLYGLA